MTLFRFVSLERIIQLSEDTNIENSNLKPARSNLQLYLTKKLR